MSDDRAWFLGLSPVTWFVLMCAAACIVWMFWPLPEDYDDLSDRNDDDLRGDEWRDK